MEESPSLRRVLAGYLRLRSPYNLCIDALLTIAVSYVMSAGQEWAERIAYQDAGQPLSPPRALWFVSQVGSIVGGLVYFAGLGVFFVACARIIADRIGPPSPGGPPTPGSP